MAANRDVNKLSRDVNNMRLCRDVNNLRFVNPGRFMENFDPEQSRREMRKVQRRFYRESRRAQRVYNNVGVRIADGADVCDCLEPDCPGCHFPCPRCSSPKCGGECRNNRCWYYTEIVDEGTGTKKVNDFVQRARSNSSTDGKSNGKATDGKFASANGKST